MTIAYFDCFSGISGDMCLGALIDAGVSPEALEKELKKIPLVDYQLSVRHVKRGHFSSCKVDVRVPTDIPRASRITRWKDLEKIIRASSLSNATKATGLNIFRRLFKAEAKVHGETFRNVHLHEIGAVDCIVDIFGTLIALDMLGVKKVHASEVNLGRGIVKSASGILPVPAPATAEILKGVPVYAEGIPHELTTPTGAAILRELSSAFGSLPRMEVAKIGIGAGTRQFKDWPNVLRVMIGTALSPRLKKRGAHNSSGDEVFVLETNIDDMNPQIFDYVTERLFKAGALDAYLTQVIMKKGRPGVVLTVLCHEDRKDDLMRLIFQETTTIGVRFYEAGRQILSREIERMATGLGTVRVKHSRYGDTLLKITPEYEDCRKIARKLKIPLIDVLKKIRIP